MIVPTQMEVQSPEWKDHWSWQEALSLEETRKNRLGQDENLPSSAKWASLRLKIYLNILFLPGAEYPCKWRHHHSLSPPWCLCSPAAPWSPGSGSRASRLSQGTLWTKLLHALKINIPFLFTNLGLNIFLHIPLQIRHACQPGKMAIQMTWIGKERLAHLSDLILRGSELSR